MMEGRTMYRRSTGTVVCSVRSEAEQRTFERNRTKSNRYKATSQTNSPVEVSPLARNGNNPMTTIEALT